MKNKSMFVFEMSMYIIFLVLLVFLYIFGVKSTLYTTIIYAVYIVISFGYLLILDIFLKDYDNAVHFKMSKKYFIGKIPSEVKPVKRKGLIGIIVLWIFYLLILGGLKYLEILNWQLFLIIINTLFILNTIFTRKLCLLSLIFMKNKNNCCKYCGINCWDYLILASSLIFAPYISIWTQILNIIVLVFSIIIFIIWEYNYHKYPERFYPKTNYALKCDKCFRKCKYVYK